MTMRLDRVVVLALLLGPASRALAQGSAAEEQQQMTLPAGKVLLTVGLELNLSKDLVGKPFSIAPDLWYGVNDDLTLGLIHSGVGRTGLYGGVGEGLCLTGSTNGCPKVYNNLGIGGRYNLVRASGFALAAAGGLFASTLDPFALALDLGVVGRLQRDQLAVDFWPSFRLGLSNRDVSTKETIVLPVTGYFMVHPKVAIALQLGLALPLESLGDTWTFLLGFGVRFRAMDKLTLDLDFAFPALAGGNLVATGGDLRTLTLGVGYAF
jgi:hypothetical protein